ncbi:IS1380 family transposase [Paenibacillus sp. LHD-117]|nr:IS1380 family transposase [Paenibacillus sp. LHD-117]MDQ6419089.1 IS1380 family transposase [Paenibacillus sp. LHD-117]
MKIQFIQSKEILLTTHTGLASVGALLSHTQLSQRLNRSVVKGMENPIHGNGDVMKSYVGLLCHGKSDFDHIEPFRKDPVFQTCFDVRKVPSSPTLRQRLDAAAQTMDVHWNEILLQESADLIRNVKAPVTGLVAGEHTVIPLDIDVSPFDNSGTKKEGISLTYKGTFGFAPIFAYLGQEGYGVHVQLREGSTHSQKDSADFLRESIHYARRITSERLLVRMDSAHDSLENLQVCHAETAVDYIIKVNLRGASKEGWLRIAEDKGIACEQRPGKTEYIGFIAFPQKGFDRNLRQVFQVFVRTIDRDGQLLLFPDVEVNVYWTSLTCSPWRVIELYRDHGTSEQFHSELKTDLDLERLPAGKFDTNDLILHAGLFAYNLLRIMGQESLREDDAPIRGGVKRRRIRTVIQNIVYIAARVSRHARQTIFIFGRYSPWFHTVRRIYQAFA